MIEEVETGRLLTTEVHPVSSKDIRSLEPGWRFNWLSEVVRAEVFKLVTVEAQETILGLMSLKRARGFIEVILLESSPANDGFTQHGNSQIMILGVVDSARLIATFEKGV